MGARQVPAGGAEGHRQGLRGRCERRRVHHRKGMRRRSTEFQRKKNISESRPENSNPVGFCIFIQKYKMQEKEQEKYNIIWNKNKLRNKYKIMNYIEK